VASQLGFGFEFQGAEIAGVPFFQDVDVVDVVQEHFPGIDARKICWFL
jgi:hypothetical protein